MSYLIEPDPNRYPGKFKEYALFIRPLGNRDPAAWKIASRWTAKHDELRDMTMPQEMLDAKLYGVGWIDNISGFEYKIMERTVEKTQWREEAKER